MKKKIVIIVLLMLAIFISGCFFYTNYHQIVGNRIYKEVTQSKEFKEKGTYSKQIRLADFTNFEWDTVCVFADCMPGMYSEDENSDLFEKCYERLNYNTGYLFLKNGKIVKFERFKADIDASSTLETKFYISTCRVSDHYITERYRFISKEDAVFKADGTGTDITLFGSQPAVILYLI